MLKRLLYAKQILSKDFYFINILICTGQSMSRDSLVGIVTRYGMDGLGIESL
jgi:hypothetical protein